MVAVKICFFSLTFMLKVLKSRSLVSFMKMSSSRKLKTSSSGFFPLIRIFFCVVGFTLCKSTMISSSASPALVRSSSRFFP